MVTTCLTHRMLKMFFKKVQMVMIDYKFKLTFFNGFIFKFLPDR